MSKGCEYSTFLLRVYFPELGEKDGTLDENNYKNVYNKKNSVY